MLNQALPITSGINFRELGGYRTNKGRTIRTHRLIRSGSWQTLSVDDAEYLVNYGVSTVVDFRSLDESLPRPDLIPTGIKGVALPTFKTMPSANANQQAAASAVKDAANEPAEQVIAGFLDAPSELGAQRMMKVYTQLATSDAAASAYQQFFDLVEEIAARDQAIVFHCSAGKDRTGIAAYLLLSVLGVPEEQRRTDYLLSGRYNEAHIQHRQEVLKSAGAPENVLKIVYDRMTVKPEYLDTYLATIREDFGNLQNYLVQQIKVSDEKQSRLRTLLLR